MEFVNLYSKSFSKIEGMQERKVLEYNLCINHIGNKVDFGVQIISACNGVREEYLSCNLSDDESLVRNVIRYLYENGIDIDTCEGILDDLCIKLNFVKAIN